MRSFIQVGGAVRLSGVARGVRTLLVLLLLAGLCVPVAHGPAVSAQTTGAPVLRYTVSVSPDPAGPVHVEMIVPAPPPLLELHFPTVAAGTDGPRLLEITVHTADGRPATVEQPAAGRFHVRATDAESLVVSYRLNLSPSLWSPSTWPGTELASVRSDNVVWLVGRDAFLEVAGFPARRQEIVLRLPDGWRAYVGDTGPVETGQPIVLDPGKEAVLLLGQLVVTRYPLPGGELTLIVSNDPPWDTGQLAWSVQAMLEGLTAKGIPTPPSDLTLAILRYPGALRLNPLIVSQLAADHTIVHWVGTGTFNWWRKHAARDLVGWLIQRTLPLAPDARWLQAGVAEYGGLALLFDIGFLTVDEMYQSLRALHSNGLHYSGAAWPSLVSAGLESPPSHAGQRVLAYRAPLVAFLIDIEVRAASSGAFTIFDLWAWLASDQHHAGGNLYTAAVVAPLLEMGVSGSFAQSYIYGSRLPPADFDGLFERWFDQQPR